MIKLTSKDNPEILAFKVIRELEQEDVDWLIERICKRQERNKETVLLYVEFEDFGELTLSRMWSHFKMFVSHLGELIANVKRIAVVTSNLSLREKLGVEFALVPTVKFKAYDNHEERQAIDWLSENK